MECFSMGGVILAFSVLAYFNLPESLDPLCNHVEMSVGSFGNPFLFIVVAIGLSYGIIFLFKWLVPNTGSRFGGAVAFLGRNSLAILLTHYIILHFCMLIPLGFLIMPIQAFVRTVLVMVISVPVILLLKKYVPNILGC